MTRSFAKDGVVTRYTQPGAGRMVQETTEDGLRRGASLSECETYRWLLWRDWGDGSDKPRALFIMLNPSTADGRDDDATIRRCIGYAKDWGCRGLVVANLFAFRATDPRELVRAIDYGIDIVGSGNACAVSDAVAMCDGGPVVCAWGTKGRILGRDQAMLRYLRDVQKVIPHYLRMTKGGYPSHPLRLPKALTPQPMETC